MDEMKDLDMNKAKPYGKAINKKSQNAHLTALWLLASLPLAILIYLMMEIRYLGMEHPFQPQNFAAVLGLSVLSCLIHCAKNKHTPGYIRQLILGRSPSISRIGYMDWLRVLAVALVILVHVLEGAYPALPPDSLSRHIMAGTAGLGLSCNLLFLMLSGALLLGGKEEPLSRFYSRRFLRVALPCFAYYVLYTFYSNGISALAPGNWIHLIRGFLSGGNGDTPHFWLVYVILLCYLASPFFQVMVKHMTTAMLEGLILVIFLLHGLYTYGPLAGFILPDTTFLASWESIFLLGYYCTTDQAMKRYPLFLTAGGLSALLILWTNFISEGFGPFLYNNALPQMFLACALFLFFRKHGKQSFVRLPAILAPISKYSFSILLIHWLSLHRIIGNVFGINGLSFGIGGGILLTFLLTLAISLFIALIYDNTVILCLNSILGHRSRK